MEHSAEQYNCMDLTTDNVSVSSADNSDNQNINEHTLTPTDLNSACTDAYQLQRKTKHILSLEQQLLQAAQEELEETLKMIEADRQRISVLQQEQTFTVRQIKDAMCQDVKQFEAILGSKQPDLLSYCGELNSTRDCLQAIRSIRQCKHHIHLAEMLVANRYATLLAERSTDPEPAAAAGAGGKMTSSAVVTFGTIPLTASPPSYVSDATTAATTSSSQMTAKKLRRLSLQSGSSSPSSSGGGKTSAGGNRTQSVVARSSTNSAGNELNPGIVRIEIRDRDAPRLTATKDQLMKPLVQSQSQSTSAGSAASKTTQKPTTKT